MFSAVQNHIFEVINKVYQPKISDPAVHNGAIATQKSVDERLDELNLTMDVLEEMFKEILNSIYYCLSFSISVFHSLK